MENDLVAKMSQTDDKPLEKHLRYHKELDKVSDVIEKYYSEVDTYAYRTVITIPPAELDMMPQKFRPKEYNPARVRSEVTKEFLDKKGESYKKRYVAEHALSVNKTEEDCLEALRKSYRNVKERAGKDEADEYMQQKRGCYIAKIHITPQTGLMEEFDDKGHANLLLYEGVTIEELYDMDYNYRKADYEEDDC